MKTIKIKTELVARHLVPDKEGYKEVDRRRVKGRCVTKAFANDIVKALRGISGGSPLWSGYDYFGFYKYHACGIGTTAESENDTYLVSQHIASWYAGSQIEGASANIYKSVAIIDFSDTYAITEHCLLNSPGTDGVMADRSVFTPIGVSPGEKIEFTFTLEFAFGG